MDDSWIMVRPYVCPDICQKRPKSENYGSNPIALSVPWCWASKNIDRYFDAQEWWTNTLKGYLGFIRGSAFFCRERKCCVMKTPPKIRDLFVKKSVFLATPISRDRPKLTATLAGLEGISRSKKAIIPSPFSQVKKGSWPTPKFRFEKTVRPYL